MAEEPPQTDPTSQEEATDSTQEATMTDPVIPVATEEEPETEQKSGTNPEERPPSVQDQGTDGGQAEEERQLSPSGENPQSDPDVAEDNAGVPQPAVPPPPRSPEQSYGRAPGFAPGDLDDEAVPPVPSAPPGEWEQSFGRASAPPPVAPSPTNGDPPPTPPPPPATALVQQEPSGPPLPPPMPGSSRPTTRESEGEKVSPNALNLSWSFGTNRRVPVLNLSDETRQLVAYTCAHTGVLYDFANNTQTLLQGHVNVIGSMCVSDDKRWLTTADDGPDHMIIVWDTLTGTPVRTIFEPHPEGGVAAVTMTSDAKYLASLSGDESQTLAIWDWTVEVDNPMCTAKLDAKYGGQRYILFNPEDVTQLVTNSDHQVIFYSWKDDQLEHFAPPLTDDDFNKPVGTYSQSIFVRNSTRALTATSLGNLVVWATNKPLTKGMDKKAAADKKALKLVKLQERSIHVLTTTERFIVVGDSAGHVKFFDLTLKLANWYQDFHLGPISSVSFAYYPSFNTEDVTDKDYPPDATIKAKLFAMRDFVIGTTHAIYGHVATDGTDVKVLLKDHDAAIHALATHPSESMLAVGSYSGFLQLWNYEEKRVVASRQFEKGLMIRCCAFDPKGEVLGLGYTNGMVRLVDAITLTDLQDDPFRYARDAITDIVFSHDSQYLATADGEFTVSAFRRQGASYVCMGRHRAHYKKIQNLMFGINLDNPTPRLLSLGEDRHLVEYDLENSDQDDLRVLSSDRIEQSAFPLCATWYPPITKETFVLTANDQYKFKLYNSTTKMCRSTLLGPTYGSPLQRILVLPTADEVSDRRYLAYVTSDKVGLHVLPLDGNPHNAMAFMAHPHPRGVANVVSSHDGRRLFTAGGADCTVHMWDVNLDALEAQSKLGGEGLVPFYGLLVGGREGPLFKELEDLFYYAQLRSQGVDTTDAREISTTIVVSEVPYIMRALGFYPSEQEIEDMLNEVKYSTYVETGQYKTEVDLGEIIRLYINHRPAFGLQVDRLLSAFQTLGLPSDQGFSIDRGELLDVLQNKGEHMTEYELAEYLTTLLGINEEGGSSELHQFDTDTAGTLIEQSLPHEITAEMMARDLLGFGTQEDEEELEEEPRGVESSHGSYLASREQTPA